ncbi:MAG TPA: tRNA lysidine(34) synthetase TilS [Terriglobales bacterium]|nr:tRNA lysidine(34) synthetase TilS [Terriglobales bacterium]
MYYVPVQRLRQDVLEYIRKHALLRAGDRVGVALSGGADSVALLRVLLELRKEAGTVLSVVHFNHKLRGVESDEDERFVAQLAQRHRLELRCESREVAAYAAEKHLSLETAAREMRYRYFRQLLMEGRLNRIATGHTLDDQAETVLLKIVRGAGSRGLAGIYPRLKVTGSQLSALSSQQEQETKQTTGASSIIRPLLGIRRRDLEAYLLALGQGWREDKSNRDLRHMRNRVRHGILPRLERYLNPAVREAFAETAEIARAEEEYWEKEVARVLPLVWQVATGGVLSLSVLVDLPLALQRRVVRAASKSLGLRLDFRHVEEILALSSNRGGSAKSTVLPEGWVVSRKTGALWFESTGETPTESDYEYRLSVPGSVEVQETKSRFEAVLVSGNAAEGYNPEGLMDRELLAGELKVRNWRPGDRFWPAHTKVAKKIKELLQDRRVTGLERKLWPVVVSGTDVVWVRGFRAPGQLRPRSVDGEAVLIREAKLEERVDFGE